VEVQSDASHSRRYTSLLYAPGVTAYFRACECFSGCPCFCFYLTCHLDPQTSEVGVPKHVIDLLPALTFMQGHFCGGSHSHTIASRCYALHVLESEKHCTALQISSYDSCMMPCVLVFIDGCALTRAFVVCLIVLGWLSSSC